MRSLLLALTVCLVACRASDAPRVRPEPRAVMRDAAIPARDAGEAPAAPVVSVAPARVVTPPPAPLEVAAPADDDTRVRRLPAVALPEVPAALEPEVRAMRRLVVRSMECWTWDGRSETHRPPADCANLYAQLARGGPAALHAMGRYIADGSPSRDARAYHTADALSSALAAHGSLDVIPYVLALVRRDLEHNWFDFHRDARIHRWLESLADLTAHDLRPVPPWQVGALEGPVMMDLLAGAYVAWARFYRAERAAPVEAVRARGLALARGRLGARDVALRTAAILRLGAAGNVDDDRAAACASLASLLAARTLSNEGRRHLRAWADRVWVAGACQQSVAAP